MNCRSVCKCFVAALLGMTMPLAAQTQTIAERLGYPANAKLLILHADDLGAAHSIDAASFEALDRGVISSGSIMMPTPWVTEVAAYMKSHPHADLGLHLTITSEWETFRWGSVAAADQVPSLLDSTGTFPKDVPQVVARAKADEVERELRAQVERALALGIHPTHLDSHMGALFSRPDLVAAYVTVAHAYHLPFLALHGAEMPVKAPLTSDDVFFDALVVADPTVPRHQWKAYYLKAIADLKPGLNEMIVHLGFDDSELRAVMVDHEPYGATWRQRDFDVVNSPEFRKALEDNHVILVTYRELQKLVPQAQP